MVTTHQIYVFGQIKPKHTPKHTSKNIHTRWQEDSVSGKIKLYMIVCKKLIFTWKQPCNFVFHAQPHLIIKTNTLKTRFVFIVKPNNENKVIHNDSQK